MLAGIEQAGGGGVSVGGVGQGLPCRSREHLQEILDQVPPVQWRKGRISWVEKCPFVSEVRGRAIMERAPNAALPQLVCGLTAGQVFGHAGACESKRERELRGVIGAVFQSVCACCGDSVCQVISKSVQYPTSH